MNIINLLQVGTQIPDFKLNVNTLFVEVKDNVIYVHTIVAIPNNATLKAYDTTVHGFQISLFTKGTVMEFAAKVGTKDWNACHFSPHMMDADANDLPTEYPADLAMPIVHVLVNRNTGTVMQMHSFALSNQFSNVLVNDYHRLQAKDFSYDTFIEEALNLAYEYSPRDIGTKAKQSYFKFKPAQ